MSGWIGRLLGAAIVVVTVAGCAPSPASLDRQYQEAEDRLRRGRVDEAMAAAAEGAQQAQEIDDQVRAWRFRLLIADVQLAKLEMPAALALLETPVPEGESFTAIRARQMQLLARARVAQGQLRQAEPLVETALPLASSDPALRLDLELLKSQLLYRTGRAADADALLASSRQRVTGEGDPYRLAQVSNTIGMGLVTRGRYDEALPFFDGILNEPSVAGTTVQGAAFNNAGLCHARLGQFDRAVALQQQAVRVQAQGRRRDYVQALGELGSTYLLQDDLEKGVEQLQQAFTIAAEAGLASDADLFARNLATAFVAMARWDDAARFNQEAARFGALASGTPSPYGIVTAAQIAAGRDDRAEATRLFESALAGADAPPGVRWVSHNGLAGLAASAGQTKQAAAHFESALRTVEETRSALLRADYRISFTTRLTQFYRGYVDLLLATGDVERALEVADSSRARVLAERQSVAAPMPRRSAASLKALARESGATLVFYWLAPQRSWVWTVTGAGITATPLPAAAQIEALVTEHQGAIQTALSDPVSTAEGGAAERLYQMLVAPIAPGLPASRSVVIVPDGALHRLNFETLTVPGPSRHYWIEDVTVQIAPSLGMLSSVRSARAEGLPSAAAEAVRSGGAEGVRSAGAEGVRSAGASAPATPTSLLLVGNATARPPEFPALSYAAAEMGSVTKHFATGTVAVLDGERASPEAFRSASPEKFDVIHFTSHAIANPETPLDSAVILSGPEQAYKLYARDVANAKLRAELVTVSACRSAGERAYAGEGLVGFAWAFLRAGSRRVVAGLWDVDDRSTAALMDRVYAGIAAGATPAAALRDAKRALMREGYAKPYYWAPFQVFTTVI